MSSEKVYVGVDIAKATLAVCFLNQHFECPNTAVGHASLLRRLSEASAPAHLICEATGGYEHALVLAVHGAGLAISVMNPRQVRDYARARNQLAKNDKVDAAILADYGAKMQPAPSPAPSAERRALMELVSVRQQLIELRSQEISRIEHLTFAPLVRDAKAELRHLTKRLEAIDALIDAQINKDAILAAKSERMQQVVGVGRVTVLTLLALMPELGQIQPGQASALAGVAPYARDSGKFRGKRHIRGGRSAVRRCSI